MKGGETISLYLGNLNPVTEIQKKKVYLQNHFCVFFFCGFFAEEVFIVFFPLFISVSTSLQGPIQTSHKLSPTPSLDEKVCFSPDDLDGKFERA